MDARRLRTFVVVAEMGSVSKAAIRLHIGQPALSRQIGDLQHELGLRLFDHVGRGLVLTSEGEQLLADCRRVLTDLDAVRERAEALRGGDRGALKVAAPPHTIESVLSRFLPRYAERFPNVDVQIMEALGPAQTAMLERGEAHVGIRFYRPDPRFESRLLPPADALAVAAPSIDLGRTGVIDVRDLASYPLLLLDPGYSVRILFDAACRLAELRPNILLESRAPHTLLALAEIGHGVAIIPSLQRTDRYAVRVARITNGRTPMRERVSIQWDKRRRLPAYALDFCDALAEYMQPILPITHPTKAKQATRGGKSVSRNSQRMKPARTTGAGLDVQDRQGSNFSKL